MFQGKGIFSGLVELVILFYNFIIVINSNFRI